MANFHYQALNADQQRVEGEVEADNVQEAIAQLETSGLTVRSIRSADAEVPPDSGGTSSASDPAAFDTQGGGDDSADTSVQEEVFQSHMAGVLEQAKILIPALRAYAEEMPAGRRRRQLCGVIRVVARGDATEATTALAKLPEYWIPLFSAAATSRDPGRVLGEFLDESQQTEELRRQWWLTFAYPVLIAVAAAAVLTALGVFVIPIFRDMYLDFDLELPQLTVVVLWLSDAIASGRILIFVTFVIAVGALLLIARRLLPSSHRARFSSPFGRRTAIARFARFTADLLDAGLDIPNALRIAGFVSRREAMQRAAWRLADEMKTPSPADGGGEWSGPADETSAKRPGRSERPGRWNRSVGGSERPGRWNRSVGGSEHPGRWNRSALTATVLHALCSDIPTTSRIHLLREVSNCYAERVRIRLSWTRGIVEPVAICVIGVLVGGIVLALFMPLVSLIEGLTGGS